MQSIFFCKNLDEKFDKSLFVKNVIFYRANTRYENVIIYMIGGLTFEESAVARAANERRATGQGGPAILLASNQMHNAHSFMSMLSHMGVHK